MSKSPVESVRITAQGKVQLTTLKRQTGIENWNVLCRWALCASLRDPRAPQPFPDKLEGGVEMTWKIFGGEHADVFAAVVRHRALRDGMADTDEAIGDCFRRHLHRGLRALSSGSDTKSIEDFLKRWALSTAATSDSANRDAQIGITGSESRQPDKAQ